VDKRRRCERVDKRRREREGEREKERIEDL